MPGRVVTEPESVQEETLEALVKRVDEDRWLASRFAEAPARKRLTALYAFNYEISRVPEIVSEPLVGQMRLTFWRDALDAIHEGRAPPAQPVAQALAEAVAEAALPRAPFDAMIEARHRDLESTPFETWSDLEAYVDATAGGLMTLAAKACAPDMEFSEQQRAALRASGRAWGYAGLVRALPYWSSQRRTFFPKRLREHVRLDEAALFSGLRADHASSSAARAVMDRATGAYREVQRLAPSLPKEAFPAIGYITLLPAYVRAFAKATDALTEAVKPGLFSRQIRLVGAAATGSL